MQLPPLHTIQDKSTCDMQNLYTSGVQLSEDALEFFTSPHVSSSAHDDAQMKDDDDHRSDKVFSN